jgi:hypothetical protein
MCLECVDLHMPNLSKYGLILILLLWVTPTLVKYRHPVTSWPLVLISKINVRKINVF